LRFLDCGKVGSSGSVPPIHLHVKKLVEQSHVCTHALQATHIFCCLVNGDHKFSIKTLSIGSIKLACAPRVYTMGTSSTILYYVHPRWTRITRNSWMTGSTCFVAVLMWPPTHPAHPSACALSLTHLSLLYPLQSVATSCLWHEGDLYGDWCHTPNKFV
jgi:hypothetical protein